MLQKTACSANILISKLVENLWELQVVEKCDFVWLPNFIFRNIPGSTGDHRRREARVRVSTSAASASASASVDAFALTGPHRNLRKFWRKLQICSCRCFEWLARLGELFFLNITKSQYWHFTSHCLSILSLLNSICCVLNMPQFTIKWQHNAKKLPFKKSL